MGMMPIKSGKIKTLADFIDLHRAKPQAEFADVRKAPAPEAAKPFSWGSSKK